MFGTAGKKRFWGVICLFWALVAFCALPKNVLGEDVTVVKVKSGDTISGISYRLYHKYNREIEQAILENNPDLVDINRINIGQQLRFPNMGAVSAKTGTAGKVSGPPPAAREQTEPARDTGPAPARAVAPQAAPTIGTGEAKEGDKLLAVFKKELKPTADLLPSGVREVEEFKPGAGAPVGTMEMVQGYVLVLHQGGTEAYGAKRDNPLFQGDTLVTGERSRIRAKMNDGSVFSLTSYSKLVIDKSVYDPQKEARESFLSLLFGKARFVVSKLKGGRGSEDFVVKTPTAICGVQGSDFALSVAPKEEALVSSTGWFNWYTGLIMIREAQAAEPGFGLATTLLTGSETTVSFAGLIGQTQTIGAFSASVAAAGSPAMGALAVTPALATEILSSVGPLMAVTRMPPLFE